MESGTQVPSGKEPGDNGKLMPTVLSTIFSIEFQCCIGIACLFLVSKENTIHTNPLMENKKGSERF